MKNEQNKNQITAITKTAAWLTITFATMTFALSSTVFAGYSVVKVVYPQVHIKGTQYAFLSATHFSENARGFCRKHGLYLAPGLGISDEASAVSHSLKANLDSNGNVKELVNDGGVINVMFCANEKRKANSADVERPSWGSGSDGEIASSASLPRSAPSHPSGYTQPRMVCECRALNGDYFSDRGCSALPINRCGRIGNLICVPNCHYE
jgi:hypothetical protein